MPHGRVHSPAAIRASVNATEQLVPLACKDGPFGVFACGHVAVLGWGIEVGVGNLEAGVCCCKAAPPHGVLLVHGIDASYWLVVLCMPLSWQPDGCCVVLKDMGLPAAWLHAA